MLKRLYCSLIVSVCCVGAFASHATAADKIIWVASSGRDTADCSDAQYPCRTISAAINQAEEGGEVGVLDRGPFPAFKVTKSVRIVSHSAVRPVIHGVLNVVDEPARPVVAAKPPATEFFMQGFAIVGSKDDGAGIVARGVANVTLRDVNIAGIASNPVALYFGGANGNAKAPADFLIESVVSAREAPEGYPDRQGVDFQAVSSSILQRTTRRQPLQIASPSKTYRLPIMPIAFRSIQSTKPAPLFWGMP